jgi:hypothetical protein
MVREQVPPLSDSGEKKMKLRQGQDVENLSNIFKMEVTLSKQYGFLVPRMVGTEKNR